MATSSIEVSFAVPVEVSDAHYRRLVEVIDEIARSNTPEGCVHWLSMMGNKPAGSKADAAFLGMTAREDAPEKGEPESDDTVLYFSTYCREK